MIPHWYAMTIWLGPIPIQVWGLFVALGFVVVIWLTVKRAPRVGVDPKYVVDFAVWTIIAAMIGARLLYIFENLTYFAQHPFEAFAIWTGGLSSYGGFIGAIVAFYVISRRRSQREISHRDDGAGSARLRFSDLVAVHLPLGWFIGRLGCYFTHDHAGVPCVGPLCVPFPDGTRRLDMGLIDGLAMLAVYPIMLWLGKRERRPGVITGVLAIWYGLQRFVFDFFRATLEVMAGTPKYFNLTLAQYLSIGLICLGIVLFMQRMREIHA